MEKNTEFSPRTSGESQKEESEGLLFGLLGRDAYPLYAQQKIVTVFGNEKNGNERQDREELWSNYLKLRKTIKASTNGDVLETTLGYIKGLSEFARHQLENRPAGGLGIHLQEATQFSFKFLLDDQGQSRFSELISTHKARLLAEVVAPMHDLLKFLGSPKAQIMPDHEIITSTFVRENFVGRRVKLKGEQHTLTQEDINFIAGVIGDHENIEKEEGRRDFISSSSEVDRAKALFFVVDVLTGVIVPEGNNFTIDLTQLDSRFTDLYFRHIDLVKGKIFRPEWGVYAVGDILATLQVLQENGLKIISPDLRTPSQILISSALQAIGRARQANDSRESPKFPEDQLTAIDKAEKTLQEFSSV